jgi:hypothetical protein
MRLTSVICAEIIDLGDVQQARGLLPSKYSGMIIDSDSEIRCTGLWPVPNPAPICPLRIEAMRCAKKNDKVPAATQESAILLVQTDWLVISAANKL